MKSTGLILMLLGGLLVALSVVQGAVTVGALLGVVLFFTGLLLRHIGAAKAFGAGFRYHFYKAGSGIAISPERKVLKLKEGSLTKEYAFGDVRSWESQRLSGGMVVSSGAGFSGASAAGAANLAQHRANTRASGLFVSVRDIDHATWRIAVLDQREQAKWMEILQQCIHEA